METQKYSILKTVHFSLNEDKILGTTLLNMVPSLYFSFIVTLVSILEKKPTSYPRPKEYNFNS